MFILRSTTLLNKDLNLTQCPRLRPWPASSSRAGLLCPAPPPRTRARTGGRPGGWGPPCSRGAAAAGSRGRGYRGSWPPPSTRGTQGITGILWIDINQVGTRQKAKRGIKKSDWIKASPSRRHNN